MAILQSPKYAEIIGDDETESQVNFWDLSLADDMSG
jgi:hypothetical protein